MGKATKIIFDDREFKKTINKYIKKIKDIKPLLKALGIQGTVDIEEHFDKESGPIGKWKPLSPVTLAARKKKRKKGRGGKYRDKILQDTGMLRTINFAIKKNNVLIGTTVKYGAKHQFGEGRIPQRKWLYISDKGKRKLIKVINLVYKHKGKLSGLKRKF